MSTDFPTSYDAISSFMLNNPIAQDIIAKQFGLMKPEREKTLQGKADHYYEQAKALEKALAEKTKLCEGLEQQLILQAGELAEALTKNQSSLIHQQTVIELRKHISSLYEKMERNKRAKLDNFSANQIQEYLENSAKGQNIARRVAVQMDDAQALDFVCNFVPQMTNHEKLQIIANDRQGREEFTQKVNLAVEQYQVLLKDDMMQTLKHIEKENKQWLQYHADNIKAATGWHLNVDGMWNEMEDSPARRILKDPRQLANSYHPVVNPNFLQAEAENRQPAERAAKRLRSAVSRELDEDSVDRVGSRRVL